MIRAGIIGVSGYTGLELVKILLAHKGFEISYLGASTDGRLSELFPQLCGVYDAPVHVASAKDVASACDVVFLALPHEKAMEFASEILKFPHVKVVDLSADYRLSRALYEKNYTTHLDPENLAHAVYGLVELNRDKIENARLIANPGCYPTCSILAAAPFVRYMDENAGVFIDAKSGVSGAGKGLKVTSHFVSVNENLNAYSPLTHRHADEIYEQLSLRAGTEFSVSFVPNLAPFTRGMVASVFGILKENIDVRAVLEEFYKNAPFVRIKDEPVSVKNVAGTHFCDIYAKTAGNKIWINSAIDNLLKGASSQAVANANLMFGFDEGEGLPRCGTSI